MDWFLYDNGPSSWKSYIDSIKWKCKNWFVYFTKFDNFHLIHLIVKKLGMFNFHPILCYCYHYCYHTHVRDLNTYFKKHSSKVGMLQRRKRRLWKTFNISQYKNVRKIQQNWTQCGVYGYVEKRADPLWCHVPILSRKKWKRQKFEKNIRLISDFFRLIFSNNVLFQMQNLFSA